MKTLITTILLLFTTIVVSQVKETSFDRVFLNSKAEGITYEIKDETILSIYDETITIKNSENIFIFSIKHSFKSENGLIINIVDGIKQSNITVIYDTNITAISFNYTDRFILFYDSKKILNTKVNWGGRK